MRVTDSAVFGSMKRQLGSARARVVSAQDTASDGLRVRKPSDDPAAFAEARRQRSRQALAEAGEKTADAAFNRLASTDDALNSVGEMLSRVRELAMEGANGTLDASNRAGMAVEVRQLRTQILAVANTEVDGQHVFAGNADGAAPFETDGSFNGTNSSRQLQAYPGVRFQTSLEGGTPFGAGTGNDVFATMDALATALEGNQPSDVRATLANIDTSFDRISHARAQVGAMMDSMDVARSVTNRYAFDATRETSRLTEVDEVSAASDLMKASTAYNAALAAAQRLPLSGLIGSAS